MRSVVFPDASRIAIIAAKIFKKKSLVQFFTLVPEAPANNTNTMYDAADINKANNVPFGIELAGSCILIKEL